MHAISQMLLNLIIQIYLSTIFESDSLCWSSVHSLSPIVSVHGHVAQPFYFLYSISTIYSELFFFYMDFNFHL